jgi:hypothetical protein
MKRVHLSYLFALLAACSAAPFLPAATPVIGAQLFQETNARIDDLFQHRVNPPKPPAPADDPFQIGDAPPPVVPKTPGDGPQGPASGAPDEVVLRQAASTLVFGGLLQIGDVQVLVINKASYKEGGILSVRLPTGPVYLRIVSITANTVTLGLNEARLTLHF